MKEDKIDQVLKRLDSIEQGQKSLEQGVKALEQGQQRNYDLIQKQGIKLEQVASDVKGVAEGHGVLLNKFEEVKMSVLAVDDKLEETRKVVGETNKLLKEHIRLPAHV